LSGAGISLFIILISVGFLGVDVDIKDQAQILEEAQNAFDSGDYEVAIEIYRKILEQSGEGPIAERMRVFLLESHFLTRDYDTALDLAEEILEGSPGSETIRKVLARRYEIGVSYLNGAQRKILGFEVGAERRGLEILTDLVGQFPFQPFAGDAVYQIATWYMRNGLYEDADRYYRRLLRDYPESLWRSTAEFRIGEAAFSRLKGVQYDFGQLIEAERQFRRYLRLHPTGEYAARCSENLEKIQGFRARRWLDVAKFYLGLEHPEATRIYLRKILRDCPETPEAKEAIDLLEKLQREDSQEREEKQEEES